MKYLSFDVGIKNLAYCLINKEDYVIEDWGILNISIDPLCEHCNAKTGQQCDKSAKYISPEGLHLCSSHKNLKSYKDLKTKNIPKKKNPVLDLGKNMVEILNEKKNFLEVDTVLIENQPSNLNGIMKTVQLLIFSYFSLLNHWDKIVDNVLLINASLKLQNHNYNPDIPIKIDTTRTKKQQKNDKYRINKYLGIEITKYYIIDNELLKNYFLKHKKKDDLADTLLQTISYIKKNNDKLIIDNVNISDNNLIDL